MGSLRAGGTLTCNRLSPYLSAMNTSLANLSAQQLRRAATIKAQIESLE